MSILEKILFLNDNANNNKGKFITELKTPAKLCEFGNATDSMIQDKIVSGLKKKDGFW